MKSYVPFLVMAIIVALAFGAARYSLADEVPCATTVAPLARTGGAAWAQGATVSVVINENDFSPTEQAAIQQAFTTWQNANTNAGV